MAVGKWMFHFCTYTYSCAATHLVVDSVLEWICAVRMCVSECIVDGQRRRDALVNERSAVYASSNLVHKNLRERKFLWCVGWWRAGGTGCGDG